MRYWAHAIAERTGPRKAKVALARKLAVIFHGIWRAAQRRERMIEAIAAHTRLSGGGAVASAWEAWRGRDPPWHSGLSLRGPLLSVRP